VAADLRAVARDLAALQRSSLAALDARLEESTSATTALVEH
jgi:hypothetical protein